MSPATISRCVKYFESTKGRIVPHLEDEETYDYPVPTELAQRLIEKSERRRAENNKKVKSFLTTDRQGVKHNAR